MCEPGSNHELGGTDSRFRDVAFGKIADGYAEHARSDFRRSGLYSLVGAVVVVAAAVSAAAFIWTDKGEFGEAVAVAALFAVASAPFWWLADRYRRSALEHRRLHQHVLTVEPYVSGFRGAAEAAARASLAQRLFARTSEDDNPLSEPTWPSGAEVADAASSGT